MLTMGFKIMDKKQLLPVTKIDSAVPLTVVVNIVARRAQKVKMRRSLN